MSQIDTPKASTVGDTQSKGCGCGGHGKHKEEAGKPAFADAGRKPEDAAHGTPTNLEESSGCCGGHKAHK